MSWTDSGPVSLPPRPVAYFAGLLLVAAAIVGVGLGFKASWRNGERGGAGLSDQAAGVDAAIPARPLVELPPPPQQEAAANTAAANSADDKDEADDNSIDAQTAAAWGLVSRVVPADTLLGEAVALAEKIAAQPPHALRLAKSLLRHGQTASYDTLMEMSAAAQAISHLTEDHMEGVEAILEKRSPTFKGA